MKLKYIFLSLLAIAHFSACSDDDNVDTTKPEIEFVTPGDDAHFHPVETFELRAILTDNEELAAWKVEIHHNADGHIHSQVIKLKHGSEHDHEEEWHFHKEGTIESGTKRYELILEIEIPNDAEHGEYHLGVFVTDKAGNENKAFITFEVEDDHDEHLD